MALETIRAELAAELFHALRDIDDDILTRDDTRDLLEVNRPKRVVPHYLFVPSLTHPEAKGRENLKQSALKKSGKKRDSRRKG